MSPTVSLLITSPQNVTCVFLIVDHKVLHSSGFSNQSLLATMAVYSCTMVVPWLYHGCSWLYYRCTMVVHGCSMVVLWLYQGYPWLYQGCPLLYHGCTMVVPWLSQDISLSSYISGACTCTQWRTKGEGCGLSMRRPRASIEQPYRRMVSNIHISIEKQLRRHKKGIWPRQCIQINEITPSITNVSTPLRVP